MEDQRSKVIIDVIQLSNHLKYNHLVQAHAVAQRLESIFKEAIVSECDGKDGSPVAEKHPYWMPYKNTLVVKSMILSGKPAEAKGFADKIAELL